MSRFSIGQPVRLNLARSRSFIPFHCQTNHHYYSFSSSLVFHIHLIPTVNRYPSRTFNNWTTSSTHDPTRPAAGLQVSTIIQYILFNATLQHVHCPRSYSASPDHYSIREFIGPDDGVKFEWRRTPTQDYEVRTVFFFLSF